MARRTAVDLTFLAAAGLSSLPAEDQKSLLHAIREELQERVGARLYLAMSARDLYEFEALQSAGDAAAAMALLDSRVPWHPQAAEEEVAILADLLAARRVDILATRGGSA